MSKPMKDPGDYSEDSSFTTRWKVPVPFNPIFDQSDTSSPIDNLKSAGVKDPEAWGAIIERVYDNAKRLRQQALNEGADPAKISQVIQKTVQRAFSKE